jgi:putative nucleotidyltransferase with HDIG domain
MANWLRSLLGVDKLSAMERQQRHHLLSLMIWVTGAGAFIIGVKNLIRENFLSAISTFILVAVVIWLAWLNARGRYFLTASVLIVVSFFVIHYNLYIGEGLHDSGILAYPILLILGTMFFGKPAAPVLFVLCTISLFLIRYSEVTGKIQYSLSTSSHNDLVTLLTLLAIAALLVWAILDNNEKNLKRIADSEAEIRLAYETTLEGWAKVLEIRDKETEGHSRRVTTLSIRLARELGCTEEEILHIRHGALLHDIGKLAIPDEILFKPGPLTEEERTVMQQHPQFARKMLEDIDFLQSALCIPYSHHERWDGTGYPQGLKGEEIPFPARIFAVVDQWEALSSNRPYRPAWEQEEIREYIRSNRGTAFDPNVVDAFLRIA